mgnify:CR=1 FL=1
MTDLLMLRHAATEWNERGLLQGRADPPLSAAGREEIQTWRLPEGATGRRCLVSPLHRAVETAELLGLRPEIEVRLIEMDWGDWQGATLAALRADPAGDIARREAAGLDFQPPGGESYRMVQGRLEDLSRSLAADGRPVVAIAHKGVMRALYAAATGWQMTGPPPDRLRDRHAMAFRLDPTGRPSLVDANVPLAQ